MHKLNENQRKFSGSTEFQMFVKLEKNILVLLDIRNDSMPDVFVAEIITSVRHINSK